MSNKKDTTYFINRAELVHGNRYDYSKSVYVTTMKKLVVTCSVHGEFLVSPCNHYKGKGCPRCVFKFRNLSEFITTAYELWGNKYDYSKSIYAGHDEKITVVCPTHGDFLVSPDNHTRRTQPCGCPKCGLIKAKLATETVRLRCKLNFIDKSRAVHGDKYSYDSSNYVKNTVKVVIKCPLHGDFEQAPSYHLAGEGCPKCQESKGEKAVAKWLENNNIQFKKQVTIKEFNPRKPFDFYLSGHNLYIEYDGIQHYKPINRFGGNNKLEEQRIRDKKRNEYCKNNNIRLLVIGYSDDLEEKLCQQLLPR